PARARGAAAERPATHPRLPSVRDALGPPRSAAPAPRHPRDRDRHPLPAADPSPAGVARALRRHPGAATRRGGRARDPLAARACGLERCGGRARGGRGHAVLRLMDGDRPALSFVVPVYNEEGNAGRLAAELTAVAQALGRSYELVFVDDGSRDG